MRNAIRWLLAASLLLLAETSTARETFHDLSVDEAMKGPDSSALHADVPIYMQGQDHPAVAENLGVFTSNRRSNGVGKTDEQACARAFVSAIIAFQERAKELGGNAVVDIKSITKHNDLVSATQYRCVAGATMSNVALTGTVVKLK